MEAADPYARLIPAEDPYAKLAPQGNDPYARLIPQNADPYAQLIPQTETGSVLGDFGRAIYDIPTQFKAAGAAALEGKDPFAEKNILDDWITEGRQRERERAALPGGEESFLGISRQDVREVPRSLASSLVSMGGGLGTGLPTAVINPALGWATGASASGALAYRMDANAFIRQVRESMDEESRTRLGRSVTDEEWKRVEPGVLDAAHRHGMFEAIPEAIGNVAGLKIITAPLKGLLGKSVTSRITSKMAGLYGTEFATETVTQMGQHNVEQEVGLQEGEQRSWTSPADWYESLKEIAPQTFLLTTILGAGGMAGHRAYQSIKGEKTPVDLLKDAAVEERPELIPDSELTSIVSQAEELAAENPGDEKLAAAVLVYQEELDRRADQPESEQGTLKPFDAPTVENTVDPVETQEPEALASKLSMEPGSQYKGMIGDAESVRRAGQASTETVDPYRSPDSTVRREKIIQKLSRSLGYPVYQGRITRARRELGFYKPRTDEVRLKNRNDIEVAAHEVAHLLDYTDTKKFRAGYHAKEYKEEVRSLSYDKTKLFEGFAEFVRHWMTDEATVREKAPKFTAWFENSLKGYKHEAAIRTAKSEMHAWFNQGQLAKFKSKIGKTQYTLGERWQQASDRWFDRGIARVVDAFHGIKLMEQDLRGKTAEELPAYMSVRLLAGMRKIQYAIFKKGTVNWRGNGDLTFTGAGLEHVFEGVTENLDDAMTYFVARRGSELMDQRREHHFTRGEIAAGLELGEKNPKFKQAFQRYQQFNQRMLDFAQTSGLVSPETRKSLDQMGRDYLPMNRVIEEVTGEVATGSSRNILRRLTGGTGNVNDVFENITGNVSLMVEASLRNMAKQQIYNLVGSTKGGARYAVQIPPETKPVWVDKAQIIKKMTDLGIKEIPENIDDLMTFFTYGHPPKGKNIDVVYYQGKPRYFEMAPGNELFMAAINAFGTKPLALGFRILGGFKTVLTRLVTASFDFLFVNSIRDTATAALTSKTGFKPVVDSLRGMKSKLQNDPVYWEAMINGMGFSSFAENEPNIVRRSMEEYYRDGKIDRTTVLDLPARILDVWDNVASASEYGARLGEYRRARAQGESARAAAFAGREVSTDFGMRGDSEFLRIFTATVPFLGARLQGSYRLFRAAAPRSVARSFGEGENPARFAAKAMVGITVPSILLYLLNRDDDRYKALPDWVRDMHWVILLPGQERAYLIPKPFEPGAFFGSMPERITEAWLNSMEGKHGNAKKLGESLAWIVGNQLQMSITPQAIKPISDIAMNKNWTGSPIVPEDLKNVKAFEQYRPWTSETMVAMGKATGMSPLELESAFNGYFGTIGGYVLMMSDSLFQAASGNPAPTRRLDEYPVLRRLLRESPLRSTQFEKEYYEMRKEIVETVATFNKIKGEGRGADAAQLLSEPQAQSYYGAGKASDQIQGVASAVNKELRLIQLNPNLSSDEKRRQMNELLKQKSILFREAVRGLSAAVPQ